MVVVLLSMGNHVVNGTRPSENNLPEDSANISAGGRVWIKPELSSLEVAGTESGIFCAAQESLNSIFDFLIGTDPNCIIGMG